MTVIFKKKVALYFTLLLCTPAQLTRVVHIRRHSPPKWSTLIDLLNSKLQQQSELYQESGGEYPANCLPTGDYSKGPGGTEDTQCTVVQMWEQPNGYHKRRALDAHSRPASDLTLMKPEKPPSYLCGCKGAPTLLDLGPGYYPRYLHSLSCNTEDCWSESHHCRPRLYKIRVLHRKEGIVLDTDPAMPEALRKEWGAEFFNVAVACECTPPPSY